MELLFENKTMEQTMNGRSVAIQIAGKILIELVNKCHCFAGPYLYPKKEKRKRRTKGNNGK